MSVYDYAVLAAIAAQAAVMAAICFWPSKDNEENNRSPRPTPWRAPMLTIRLTIWTRRKAMRWTLTLLPRRGTVRRVTE
jgi:hypothetical protein